MLRFGGEGSLPVFLFRGGSGRGPKRIRTMRIDILTVVPELLVSPLNESILKRAQRAGLVETHEGAVGGYRFEGSADTVTLCDIAQAVGAAFVSASWRSGDVDKPCLVASGMGALMDEVYTGLDALCKERLQSVTVAALEARLFDGKPLAGPCGRAKKEKAAAAHGGAK